MLLLNHILKFCTLVYNYILNYFYYEQEYSIAKNYLIGITILLWVDPVKGTLLITLFPQGRKNYVLSPSNDLEFIFSLLIGYCHYILVLIMSF